jgi:hypothetical protein
MDWEGSRNMRKWGDNSWLIMMEEETSQEECSEYSMSVREIFILMQCVHKLKWFQEVARSTYQEEGKPTQDCPAVSDV